MNHYYSKEIFLPQNILVVGGIFSAIAGVCELYKIQSKQIDTRVLLRVSAHMTGGFIYGMSLSYFWQIPAFFSVYNIAKGFYGN